MKRGISFSGGGDKGAFAVGVFKRLYEQNNYYDSFSGTSTGALIAPLAALGKIEILEDTYTNISKKDIFTNDTMIYNLLTKRAIYDITPLKKLVERIYTEQIFDMIMNTSKNIYIATVCLNSGKLVYFSNHYDKNRPYQVIEWIDAEHMRQSIVASCVQPFLMAIQDVRGFKYADGGLKEYSPISVLIDDGCEDITSIINTTKDTSYYVSNPYLFSLPEILERIINIFSSDVADNDVKLSTLYNDGIKYQLGLKERLIRQGIKEDLAESLIHQNFPFDNKRFVEFNIIRPNIHLGPGLDFNTEHMRKMFNYGYKDLVI